MTGLDPIEVENLLREGRKPGDLLELIHGEDDPIR
jgi:hypothetical protein